MQNEKPSFPTGYGERDTHAIQITCRETGRLKPNPHASAGKPYATVTGADIAKMVDNPPSVPKKRGQWFIPSVHADHDARSHNVQRKKGAFRWLTLDVDQNNLELTEIDEALSEIIGDARRMIYCSRSATEDDKKWRALVPIKGDLTGAEFEGVQKAYFDLLEQASASLLIPDRALARPGQLVYLPNRGEFYQHHIHKGSGLLELTPDCQIIVRRDEVATERAQSPSQRAVAAIPPKPRQPRPEGQESPVGAFNAAHDLTDLLTRYGYRHSNGPHWISPNSTTGSAAVEVMGQRWRSLSGSDARAKIGAESASGDTRTGDAFDLYAHYEHGGKYTEAVKAYAQKAGLSRHVGASVSLDDFQMSGLEGQETRSFEELLQAAEALEPGQIEDMEGIVAECAGLNPMRADAVFRAIKDTTKVPLGTIRAQLSRERDAIPEPDHLDLARMALDQIGRANVICADAFVWRWQDRGVWTQQDDRAIKQAVQARLDAEEMIDVTAALVNGVTDVFKSEIYKPEHKFNLGNPETVNCLNGEMALDDLVGWRLEPHCRENYRTTQIPVEYDPKADAPMFRAFLEQVFRDDHDCDDKIRAVLELMGYTLMSHARHERFVMLIGPGANGKSVLLAVLEGLLGSENVAGVQPSNFDRSFQRAHLHQKLANIVTELKQGEVIADAELKGITSGEPSTVEHKFKDPFVMRPFATCWFGTNHMPHTRDFSEALFRRATILQFNRTFAKEEQDPQLKDKLLAELPGILNMCLDAYDCALFVGFTEPQSSDEAKKEWRLEADQVALFVQEQCHRDPDTQATMQDVFLNYQVWASSNGISKTMSKKGLRDRLTRLGFGAARSGAHRYVTGLRIED